jgi:hypothetical protein
MKKRPVSFEQAKARYVHRFTMEHVPDWAKRPAPYAGALTGYYAPQFSTDRQWYDSTRFKGEEGWLGRGSDCYTTGQTWPLGRWLMKPFAREFA